MKRPKGLVRIRVCVGPRLLYSFAKVNLFVNAGLPALAALLGGDRAGNFATAIGFGSGSKAPTVNDTGLTAPAYYKAIGSHSEDGNGSVTFNLSLTTSDTGARGITIQALALFANSARARRRHRQ